MGLQSCRTLCSTKTTKELTMRTVTHLLVLLYALTAQAQIQYVRTLGIRASDPVGACVNGYHYYNSVSNKERCCASTAWLDCSNASIVITSQQVAFGSGVDAVTGSSNFSWDGQDVLFSRGFPSTHNFKIGSDPDPYASYSKLGGTGNRTSVITPSVNFTLFSTSDPLTLVDGNTSSVAVAGAIRFDTAAAASGKYIRFDFGSGTSKIITEAILYQNTADSHGVWQWQGSNDASAWTSIGGTFTLGGATPTQTQTTLSANTTGYRYYQILGVSGNLSITPWLAEFQFKIVDANIISTTPLFGRMQTYTADGGVPGSFVAIQPEGGDVVMGSGENGRMRVRATAAANQGRIDINAGALSVQGENLFRMIGTLHPTSTSAVGTYIETTANNPVGFPGSQYGVFSILRPGLTGVGEGGNTSSFAGQFYNNKGGTAGDGAGDWATPKGIVGVGGYAVPDASNVNSSPIGVLGLATGSAGRQIGVLGKAQGAGNTNVGIWGIAVGGGTVNVGGLFVAEYANPLNLSGIGTTAVLAVSESANVPLFVGGSTASATRTFVVEGDGRIRNNVNGLVSNMSLAISGTYSDTNTGFWKPADNALAIANNGTNTLYLTSGSLVGMGTDTPQSKLDVEGSVCIGSTYSGTTAAPANGMIVEGLVGLGTVAPTSHLQVAQTTAGIGTVATNGTVNLTGTGTRFTNTFKVGDTITVSGETIRTIATISSDTTLTSTVAFATTASGLSYTLVGGDRLVVKGNGNVGIGVTPTERLSLKNHAAFAGSETQTTTGAVQTTNVTQTTLMALTLSDTSVYWIEAEVVARRQDVVGARGIYKFTGLCYREGGNATIEGQTNLITIESAGGAVYDAVFTAAGNDCIVSVSGDTGNTVNWAATVRYQRVSGSG